MIMNDPHTPYDSVARVRHMLDFSREAFEMAHGRSRTDFDTDRLLNLSLTRLIELIGEAAWWVDREFRAQHPDVPWADIIGMRQHLTHGYAVIKYDDVWQVVREGLLPLIAQLQAIITPPRPPRPPSSAVA